MLHIQLLLSVGYVLTGHLRSTMEYKCPLSHPTGQDNCRQPVILIVAEQRPLLRARTLKPRTEDMTKNVFLAIDLSLCSISMAVDLDEPIERASEAYLDKGADSFLPALLKGNL
jgi:hypothetical protein